MRLGAKCLAVEFLGNLLVRRTKKGVQSAKQCGLSTPIRTQRIASRIVSVSRFSARGRSLRRGLVVASGAAGFAVQEAVVAKAHVDHGLAKAAEFFALTGALILLALRTFVFDVAGCGTHASNVACPPRDRKMTLVIVLRQAQKVPGSRLLRTPSSAGGL